jgi:hypothetical protein
MCSIHIVHDNDASAEIRFYFQLQQSDCKNTYIFGSDIGDITVFVHWYFASKSNNLCDNWFLEYVLKTEPNLITLEYSDVVQLYSLEDCNMMFNLCHEIDASNMIKSRLHNKSY